MSSSAGSSSGPSHSLSPTTTPLVDHRYQLEQDGSGYSLRELQSGREIWHTSAFFRTKEVVKQLESSQNVDLDIVDSQPMVNKPRNTESKEEPLVNHLTPNTWAYAPGRGKPFISLTGIESTRLQSIPFPRSMVYAFFPSSTGVPAPTPSKSSLMNSVDLDKRVKFTTWMYNNHLKKYGFSLPSLPSDLEQAMMSAGPISPQPHTRHLHPTHSTTPNPPNGPSAFPSTLSSSPSPTPSSEFTAYLFAAWINDKAQQAPVSIPHMSGSKMATFAFKDKEPLVECVFLGAFLYTLAPPETKESPSPPPLSNAVTVSFDDGTGNNLTFTPPQGGRSLTSPAPGEDLNWKFTQSFGDDNSSDDDLVTAMAFDHQGHFLAVGDKAGRICIFEAHPPVHTPSGCDYVDFKFYTEFQSHGPEFDCLKSLEIEERISMLRWLKQPTSGGRFLLSTNDKTIKLWKVHEKKFYELSNPTQASSLALPPVPASRLIRTASCKRVFGNAHQYHINSISINSDGQTFISADDLRVYLWHLEDNKECFNVIDVKPPDLQELNEVITTVTFHPFQCNSLMYGTSRGNIRLVDFRSNAICDRYTRQFHYDNANPPPQEQSFFSEIISSISDCKFTDDGRFIISRDYLTLKIWDIRNEQRPLSIVPVHDYLQPYLSDLYENDCIFDKFQCHANHAGTRYLTGSYNNNFLIYDAVRGSVCTIEAKDTEPSGPQPQNETPDVEMMDFAKKSLHLSWHPSEEVIAVAGMNKIYIYQAALQRPHL